MAIKDVLSGTIEAAWNNKRATALILLLAIGAFAWINRDSDQPTVATPPAEQPALADISAETSTPQATDTATSTLSRAVTGGEQYPYATQLFYQYAYLAITGFSSENCFIIPNGGTAWAAVVLGGPDNTTRYDTTQAWVGIVDSVGGIKIIKEESFDPRQDPTLWPEWVSSIPANTTIGCAQ